MGVLYVHVHCYIKCGKWLFICDLLFASGWRIGPSLLGMVTISYYAASQLAVG